MTRRSRARAILAETRALRADRNPTPREQMECYRTARRAYEDGTGSLQAMQAAVTTEVAALISLEERAAARRRREAAETEALRVREAETRAAQARAARWAAFREDARSVALILGAAILLFFSIGVAVNGVSVAHRVLSPRPAAAWQDPYPAERFTSSGLLTIWYGSSPRSFLVLGITERDIGGRWLITWVPADGSPSPGWWDRPWAFMPDDLTQPPLSSDTP